jgi:hypothetical protein
MCKWRAFLGPKLVSFLGPKVVPHWGPKSVPFLAPIWFLFWLPLAYQLLLVSTLLCKGPHIVASPRPTVPRATLAPTSFAPPPPAPPLHSSRGEVGWSPSFGSKEGATCRCFARMQTLRTWLRFMDWTDLPGLGIVPARIKFHGIVPFDCPLRLRPWLRGDFRAVKNCVLVPRKWSSRFHVFVAAVKLN